MPHVSLGKVCKLFQITQHVCALPPWTGEMIIVKRKTSCCLLFCSFFPLCFSLLFAALYFWPHNLLPSATEALALFESCKSTYQNSRKLFRFPPVLFQELNVLTGGNGVYKTETQHLLLPFIKSQETVALVTLDFFQMRFILKDAGNKGK